MARGTLTRRGRGAARVRRPPSHHKLRRMVWAKQVRKSMFQLSRTALLLSSDFDAACRLFCRNICMAISRTITRATTMPRHSSNPWPICKCVCVISLSIELHQILEHEFIEHRTVRHCQNGGTRLDRRLVGGTRCIVAVGRWQTRESSGDAERKRSASKIYPSNLSGSGNRPAECASRQQVLPVPGETLQSSRRYGTSFQRRLSIGRPDSR